MYYRVVVRHNLVEAVRRQKNLGENQTLLVTNLDAGAELSRNNQQNACIDGDYWFDDFEQAKAFASICMDFVNKVLEKRLDAIDRLEFDSEYFADSKNIS